MAVQQPAQPWSRSTSEAPKLIGRPDPTLTSWADDVDEPIRLARFPCCGCYVCRCDEDDEEAWVNRQAPPSRI